MNDSKVKILVYLGIMGLVVGIVLLVMIFTNKQDNPEDIHTPIDGNYVLSEVYDINEYQTVYNCLREYFSVLNNDSISLYSLLYEDYKIKNSISLSNIDNFVEKKYSNFNYSIQALEKYSNVFFSFYFVESIYTLDELDFNVEETKVKDILILDIVNGTFSVLPVLNLNAGFYEMIQLYQLNDYNKEISKTEHNEIRSGFVSEFNEAMMYFMDYMYILNNNCSQAYYLLGEATRKNYSKIDDFRIICNQFQTKYNSPAIVSYKVSFNDGKKNIKITDNYSIDYSFEVNSVKNYRVDFEL